MLFIHFFYGPRRVIVAPLCEVALTVKAHWNRLNEGCHLDKGLQEARDQHGASAFDYIVVEVIEEEMTPLVLKETLKSRKAEWIRILTQERKDTEPLPPA